MMEVDITDKVGRAARYSIAGGILLFFSILGIIYSWQMSHRYVTLHNGQIVGKLVHIKNMAPGVITEVLVTDGETVEAGQALAKLRVKVLPEQIGAMEKAVEMAKARYNELLTRPAAAPAPRQASQPAARGRAAENALNQAKQEKEKMDKLFAIGGISAVKHKEATAKYESALKSYQARQAAPPESAAAATAVSKEKLLKVAALQIQQAQDALAKMRREQIVEIKAAVSGAVYLKDIEAGRELAAGQDVFAIGDLREAWLEVPVSEEQKEKLALGQFVRYTLTDYPRRHFTGTVYEMIEKDDAAEGGGKGSLIRISIPEELDVQIRPGMKAKAKISV